jgi:hypothetical protein
VQIVKLNEKVYERANFSAKQKIQLSHFWQLWRRQRQALDDALKVALKPLERLPSIQDLPIDALNYISMLADGCGAVRFMPQCCLGKSLDGLGRARAHCPCLPCAVRGLGGLWNGSSGAERSIRMLQALQDDDLEMQNEWTAKLYSPSNVICARTLVMAQSQYLECLAWPGDCMYLCKLAAEEERFGQIFIDLPLRMKNLQLPP